MTLGERILNYRKRAGLSQERLAELLGVSRQAVSKWEGDAAQPELDKIVALARLFGITTDQPLLGERPNPGPPTEARLRRENPDGICWGFCRWRWERIC